MSPVVTEFAPAKVNLALHVLGRRSDGYHELDSVVAFAQVGDELALQRAAATTLAVTGPFAAAVPTTADNLVLRAHAALAQHVALPPVAFSLIKNLPVASGIGGGSADAAAALRGLLRLAEADVEPAELSRLALTLGADVPVCLHGKACRMQGVGEVITPVSDLTSQALLLVNPLQACSTTAVFRGMGLKPGDVAGSAVDVRDPASWRNDMTAAACGVLPTIREVLHVLSQIDGGIVHRMSGSGATCFALFESLAQAETAARNVAKSFPHWWVTAAALS
jgi:4-diphosphocytidyl-2-C-methyl-D-erythritol kinase